MIDAKKYTVFFDFDNTITTHDVVDSLLLRFSGDNHWLKLERKWRKGLIGSRECLKGQLERINLDKQTLDEYLAKVRLDPHFKRLIRFLNAKRIKTVVLSDNFDYILQRVLKNNKIQNLKIYSNRLKVAKNRLTLDFPFTNKSCRKCAHCKTKNLLTNADKNSIMIYIGDGLSDVCPAKYTNIAFAKDELLQHFREKKIPCVPYKTLGDVYNYFRRTLA